MQWLVDCTSVAIPEVGTFPPVRDIVELGDLIPDRDGDAALERVDCSFPTHHVYSWMGFEFAPRPLLARGNVLRRLDRARRRLPAEFDIVVIDGWRPRKFQTELFEYYQQPDGTDLDAFVADPDNEKETPPHLTGCALDLTLSWRGAPLGLGTDFDSFAPESTLDAFEPEDRDKRVRDLRRLLAHVLTSEKFVCYPREWWHWSYRDNYWATMYDAPDLAYGEAEPAV